MKTNTGLEYATGTYFDKNLQTGETDGVSLKKGQLMGDFNFGSTIVLIFEAPANFEFRVDPGCKVKYGQPFGTYDGQQVKRRRYR